MAKHCFKCGTHKPLHEFYEHPRMKDGHLNKCKDCTKADTRARLALGRLNPEWLRQERARGRIKQAKARADGTAASPSKEVQSRWSRQNRPKKRAQAAAAKAVQRGHLNPTEACEHCGKRGVKLEKHHPDYSRPLFVEWLCVACHGVTRRLP